MLMPVDLITSSYFVISACRSSATSCGLTACGTAPICSNDLTMAGLDTALRKASLSVLSTSSGKPAGASIPLYKVSSASGMPASRIVGTSAIAGIRAGVVTANGRNLPACTCVIGDSELDEGVITVKNMANGTQEKVALKELNAEWLEEYTK